MKLTMKKLEALVKRANKSLDKANPGAFLTIEDVADKMASIAAGCKGMDFCFRNCYLAANGDLGLCLELLLLVEKSYEVSRHGEGIVIGYLDGHYSYDKMLFYLELAGDVDIAAKRKYRANNKPVSFVFNRRKDKNIFGRKVRRFHKRVDGTYIIDRTHTVPKSFFRYHISLTYMLEIISNLEIDEYQPMGMAIPMIETVTDSLDIVRLFYGGILPFYDSGCNNPKCSCHTATEKEVHWLEAFQDAEGEWYIQAYRTYNRYSVK